MFEILASVLSGGVTGLLGSAITGVMAYFKQKEINKQTLALKQLDIQVMEMEITAGRELAEIRRDTVIDGKAIDKERAVEVAEVKMMEASMREVEMVTGSKIRNSAWFAPFFILIDLVRAGIRPILTVYLVVLVSYIYSDMQSIMGTVGTGFDPDKAQALLEYIVYAIVYLLQTCVTWWFGTRLKTKMFETKR